jgi:hypothetical protein
MGFNGKPPIGKYQVPHSPLPTRPKPPTVDRVLEGAPSQMKDDEKDPSFFDCLLMFLMLK